MTKVDVVIPCYNYGRFLDACVESVRSQGVADHRILIIDDASSDDSAALGRRLAAADPRTSLVSHAKNRGHIATFNEGIAWASADYFVLLSADDMLAPGALRRAVSVMDENSDIVLTHGAAVDWCDAEPLPPITEPASFAFRRQDLIAAMCESGSNLVCTPAAVSRTSVQKRVGDYDPALPHTGDMHMWMRLAHHGPVASIDHAVQAIYRKHATNMSHAYNEGKIRDFEGRREAFSAYFAEAPASEENARLHAGARSALARQAYWSGVARACRGQWAGAQKLLRFAWDLEPGLRFRPPFRQLAKSPNLPLKIAAAIAGAKKPSGPFDRRPVQSAVASR